MRSGTLLAFDLERAGEHGIYSDARSVCQLDFSSRSRNFVAPRAVVATLEVLDLSRWSADRCRALRQSPLDRGRVPGLAHVAAQPLRSARRQPQGTYFSGWIQMLAVRSSSSSSREQYGVPPVPDIQENCERFPVSL